MTINTQNVGLSQNQNLPAVQKKEQEPIYYVKVDMRTGTLRTTTEHKEASGTSKVHAFLKKFQSELSLLSSSSDDHRILVDVKANMKARLALQSLNQKPSTLGAIVSTFRKFFGMGKKEESIEIIENILRKGELVAQGAVLREVTSSDRKMSDTMGMLLESKNIIQNNIHLLSGDKRTYAEKEIEEVDKLIKEFVEVSKESNRSFYITDLNQDDSLFERATVVQDHLTQITSDLLNSAAERGVELQ